MTNELETLEPAALDLVDGGTVASMSAAIRHGAFEAYKTAVSYPTAAIGGWQLAGQMYGPNVTMHDRVRAMGAVRGVLAASDALPAWSHTLPAWLHR